MAVAAAQASDGAAQVQLASVQAEAAAAKQTAADAMASRDEKGKDAAAAQLCARQAASELDETRRKLSEAEEELRTSQCQITRILLD